MTTSHRAAPHRHFAPLLAAVLLATTTPALAQQPTASPAAPPAAPPPAPAATATTAPALQAVPTPKPGAQEAEAAHMARYDAAIAPVRNHQFADADGARLRSALARIAAIDPAGLRSERDGLSDPIARKLVDWLALRAGIGSVADYRAFLAANPLWPNRALLKRRFEEELFKSAAPAAEVKAIFAAEPPVSAAGHAALAVAHLADNDKAAASRHAAVAWRQHDISASLEPVMIERIGSLLSAADHKWRLDRLLIEDIRWNAQRRARVAEARRAMRHLGADEQRKAEARIAVLLRQRDASKLLAKLPADKPAKAADRDWGLQYHRIQDLRRRGKAEEAARLLLAVPLSDADAIVSPDDWWHERRSVSFELLEADKPKLAYQVVKTAGPLSVNPLKDQSFKAGWLALRYLRDAKLAEQHFAAMRKVTDGPLSSAQAAYWLGRAADAQASGKSGSEAAARARKHYQDAARFADTFHGQLARARLGPDAATLHVGMPAAPTPQQLAAFRAQELPRATVIAHRAGLPAHIRRTLLARMQLNENSEAGAAMVAHLSQALGDTQMTVRIGKAAVARGFDLLVYSYPLHAFPAFKPLRQPPEMALLLGVARQESEFNTQTKSGAGARGILQVMPITARHVCRDYRIKCDIARLMTDESYNAALGSAYIADRMGEFRGSYVLGIAGYNAGPGRARQWIREFGDPRDPGVDVIDWIHRIPFDETRSYVQKVLSNLQVYRARLAPGQVPIQVMSDLARGRAR